MFVQFAHVIGLLGSYFSFFERKAGMIVSISAGSVWKLILVFAVSVASAQEDGCSKLERDLECSACTIFIDEFFNSVARAPAVLFKEGASTKNLWHEKVSKLTPARVYEQRIRAIYEQHAPKKARRVYSLMKKYKNNEYELYERICEKYGVGPEPEFESPDDEEEEDVETWKLQAAKQALATVKAYPKKDGMQWAVSGAKGKRKFADFNKLMSSGGTMENLSMGGNVADDLAGCFEQLAASHGDELGQVVEDSDKPFSSGLHKTFCKAKNRCGRKKNEDL